MSMGNTRDSQVPLHHTLPMKFPSIFASILFIFLFINGARSYDWYYSGGTYSGSISYGDSLNDNYYIYGGGGCSQLQITIYAGSGIETCCDYISVQDPVGTEQMRIANPGTYTYTTIAPTSSVLLFFHTDGSVTFPSIPVSVDGVGCGPTAPQNVRVTSRSTTQLGIAWDAPASNGGYSIQYYILYWSYNGGSQNSMSIASQSYIISTNPGTRVTSINVLAVTAGGSGPSSSPFDSYTTMPPPASFTGVSYGNGAGVSLYITPDSSSSPYVSFYRTWINGAFYGDSPSSQVDINGLGLGTTYSFEIAAFSVHSIESTHLTYSITTFTWPSAPVVSVGTVTPTTIQLNWPAPWNGGSALTTFYVYVDGVMSSQSAAGPGPFTYTNPTPFYFYSQHTFQVSVWNSVGESARSTMITQYTAMGVPVLTGISSIYGVYTGASVVTISGTQSARFVNTGTLAVRFGSTPATSITFINDVTIQVLTPSYPSQFTSAIVSVANDPASGYSTQTAYTFYFYGIPIAPSNFVVSYSPGATPNAVLSWSFSGETDTVNRLPTGSGFSIYNEGGQIGTRPFGTTTYALSLQFCETHSYYVKAYYGGLLGASSITLPVTVVGASTVTAITPLEMHSVSPQYVTITSTNYGIYTTPAPMCRYTAADGVTQVLVSASVITATTTIRCDPPPSSSNVAFSSGTISASVRSCDGSYFSNALTFSVYETLPVLSVENTFSTNMVSDLYVTVAKITSPYNVNNLKCNFISSSTNTSYIGVGTAITSGPSSFVISCPKPATFPANTPDVYYITISHDNTHYSLVNYASGYFSHFVHYMSTNGTLLESRSVGGPLLSFNITAAPFMSQFDPNLMLCAIARLHLGQIATSAAVINSSSVLTLPSNSNRFTPVAGGYAAGQSKQSQVLAVSCPGPIWSYGTTNTTFMLLINNISFVMTNSFGVYDTPPPPVLTIYRNATDRFVSILFNFPRTQLFRSDVGLIADVTAGYFHDYTIAPCANVSYSAIEWNGPAASNMSEPVFYYNNGPPVLTLDMNYTVFRMDRDRPVPIPLTTNQLPANPTPPFCKYSFTDPSTEITTQVLVNSTITPLRGNYSLTCDLLPMRVPANVSTLYVDVLGCDSFTFSANAVNISLYTEDPTCIPTIDAISPTTYIYGNTSLPITTFTGTNYSLIYATYAPLCKYFTLPGAPTYTEWYAPGNVTSNSTVACPTPPSNITAFWNTYVNVTLNTCRGSIYAWSLDPLPLRLRATPIMTSVVPAFYGPLPQEFLISGLRFDPIMSLNLTCSIDGNALDVFRLTPDSVVCLKPFTSNNTVSIAPLAISIDGLLSDATNSKLLVLSPVVTACTPVDINAHSPSLMVTLDMVGVPWLSLFSNSSIRLISGTNTSRWFEYPAAIISSSVTSTLAAGWTSTPNIQTGAFNATQSAALRFNLTTPWPFALAEPVSVFTCFDTVCLPVNFTFSVVPQPLIPSSFTAFFDPVPRLVRIEFAQNASIDNIASDYGVHFFKDGTLFSSVSYPTSKLNDSSTSLEYCRVYNYSLQAYRRTILSLSTALIPVQIMGTPLVEYLDFLAAEISTASPASVRMYSRQIRWGQYPSSSPLQCRFQTIPVVAGGIVNTTFVNATSDGNHIVFCPPPPPPPPGPVCIVTTNVTYTNITVSVNVTNGNYTFGNMTSDGNYTFGNSTVSNVTDNGGGNYTYTYTYTNITYTNITTCYPSNVTISSSAIHPAYIERPLLLSVRNCDGITFSNSLPIYIYNETANCAPNVTSAELDVSTLGLPQPVVLVNGTGFHLAYTAARPPRCRFFTATGSDANVYSDVVITNGTMISSTSVACPSPSRAMWEPSSPVIEITLTKCIDRFLPARVPVYVPPFPIVFGITPFYYGQATQPITISVFRMPTPVSVPSLNITFNNITVTLPTGSYTPTSFFGSYDLTFAKPLQSSSTLTSSSLLSLRFGCCTSSLTLPSGNLIFALNPVITAIHPTTINYAVQNRLRFTIQGAPWRSWFNATGIKLIATTGSQQSMNFSLTILSQFVVTNVNNNTYTPEPDGSAPAQRRSQVFVLETLLSPLPFASNDTLQACVWFDTICFPVSFNVSAIRYTPPLSRGLLPKSLHLGNIQEPIFLFGDTFDSFLQSFTLRMGFSIFTGTNMTDYSVNTNPRIWCNTTTLTTVRGITALACRLPSGSSLPISRYQVILQVNGTTEMLLPVFGSLPNNSTPPLLTPSILAEGLSFQVLDPNTTERPTAMIEGPPIVGRCANISLTGRSSLGGNSRPLTRYLWDSNSTVAQATAWVLDSSQFPVPAAAVPPGSTVGFTLQVEDASGLLSLPYSFAVSKALLDVPQVMIQSPRVVTAKRSVQLVFSAKSVPPSCIPPDGVMPYQWTLSPAPASGFSATAASTSSTLIIPRNALSASTTYTLNARTWNPLDLTAEATHDISISIGTQPLVARIAGGSRAFSVAQELIVNASLSSDPDDSPLAASFSWVCTMVRDADGDTVVTPSSEVCPGFAAIVAAASNPAVLSFPPRFFPETTAIAMALVYSKADNRSASTNVTVFAQSPSLPRVTIDAIGPLRVNPQSKLAVRGLLVNAGTTISGETQSVTYRWRCRQLEAANNLTSLTGSSFLLSSDSRLDIVFAPNTFTDTSITYSIRLIASNSDGDGWSQIDVIVNQPPQGGSFAVSPREGTLETTFDLSATNWVDPDSPLVYTFYMRKEGSTDRSVIAAASSTSAVSLASLPTGTLYFFASVTDSLGASSFTSEVSVVIHPPTIPAGVDKTTFLSSKADSLLDGALKSGDVGSALLVVGSLSSMLTPSQGAAEDAAAVTARATLREKMVSSVFDALSDPATSAPSSTDALQQRLDSLSSVTSAPKEISPRSRDLVLDLMESASTAPVLDEASRKRSADCVANLASSVMTSPGATPSAFVSHVRYSLLLDESHVFAFKSRAYSTANMAPSVAASMHRMIQFSTKTVAQQAAATATSINSILGNVLNSAVGDMVAGEKPVAIVSGSVALQGTRDSGANLANRNFTTAGSNSSSFALPSSILDGTSLADNPEANVDVKQVQFAGNIYGSASSATVKSGVTSFKLTTGNTELPINNLPQPIRITIPLAAPINSTAAQNRTASCRYWNTVHSNWTSDGCRALNATQLPAGFDSSTAIICECNHLTSFAIIEEDIMPEMNIVNPGDITSLANLRADAIAVVCTLWFIYGVSAWVGRKLDLRDMARRQYELKLDIQQKVEAQEHARKQRKIMAKQRRSVSISISPSGANATPRADGGLEASQSADEPAVGLPYSSSFVSVNSSFNLLSPLSATAAATVTPLATKKEDFDPLLRIPHRNSTRFLQFLADEIPSKSKANHHAGGGLQRLKARLSIAKLQELEQQEDQQMMSSSDSPVPSPTSSPKSIDAEKATRRPSFLSLSHKVHPQPQAPTISDQQQQQQQQEQQSPSSLKSFFKPAAVSPSSSQEQQRKSSAVAIVPEDLLFHSRRPQQQKPKQKKKKSWLERHTAALVSWIYRPGFWRHTFVEMRKDHPWVGLIFGDPTRELTRPMRATIIFSGLMCGLMATSLFFGTSKPSISKIIVASLISTACVFPATTLAMQLFRSSHHSYKRQKAIQERFSRLELLSQQEILNNKEEALKLFAILLPAPSPSVSSSSAEAANNPSSKYEVGSPSVDNKRVVEEQVVYLEDIKQAMCVLAPAALRENVLQKALLALDKNGDEQFDFIEFLDVYCMWKQHQTTAASLSSSSSSSPSSSPAANDEEDSALTVQELVDLMLDVDADNKGYISREDMRAFMKEVAPDMDNYEFRKFFESMDYAKDGCVSYSDFAAEYRRLMSDQEEEDGQEYFAFSMPPPALQRSSSIALKDEMSAAYDLMLQLAVMAERKARMDQAEAEPPSLQPQQLLQEEPVIEPSSPTSRSSTFTSVLNFLFGPIPMRDRFVDRKFAWTILVLFTGVYVWVAWTSISYIGIGVAAGCTLLGAVRFSSLRVGYLTLLLSSALSISHAITEDNLLLEVVMDLSVICLPIIALLHMRRRMFLRRCALYFYFFALAAASLYVQSHELLAVSALIAICIPTSMLASRMMFKRYMRKASSSILPHLSTAIGSLCLASQVSGLLVMRYLLDDRRDVSIAGIVLVGSIILILGGYTSFRKWRRARLNLSLKQRQKRAIHPNFLYVAYGLCICTSLFATYYTLLIATAFDEDKSRAMFQSFSISTVQEIFLLQPFKVFGFAVHSYWGSLLFASCMDMVPGGLKLLLERLGG